MTLADTREADMAMTDDTTAAKNTDREIWRGPDEGNGDFYADSIHVTEGGGIGINCGGYVIVKPAREWHRLAASLLPSPNVHTSPPTHWLAPWDASKEMRCAGQYALEQDEGDLTLEEVAECFDAMRDAHLAQGSGE